MLATEGRVSAATQNQAFSALLFLFRDVLGRKLEGLGQVVRAKPTVRLPLVLSRAEVAHVLDQMHGTTRLMASLMYGAGLRLLECARLRVKDVDLPRGELTVRDGKGRKDRVTVMPTRLVPALQAHLERVRRRHDADLSAGAGHVSLPDALGRKYPAASRARSRMRCGRPASPSRPRAIRCATLWRRTCSKRATTSGPSMIYTHVLNVGGRGVRSPFDQMPSSREY